MTDADVLIVGAGPAGCSTALHLVQRDPAWAGRLLVIDRATFPREKVCGGGITYFGYQLIEQLGLEEPECFPARTARVHFGKRSFSFVGEPTVRIVAREVFDHWLLRKVEEAGVEVRQGVALNDVQITDDEVIAETDRGTLHARTIVAADGSLSRVRQALKWPDRLPLGRTLEIITPVDPVADPEYRSQAMAFDFTGVATHKLQGYTWNFPTSLDGRPAVNRGVYDSRILPKRTRANLKLVLTQAVERRGYRIDDYRFKSAPIRWWDGRARVAAHRVLLAGDAAGADPLLGEGIPFAIGFGGAAAASLDHAFAADNFAFSEYGQRLLAHPIVRQIPTRAAIARIGYGFPNRLFLNVVWTLVGALVPNLETAGKAWRLFAKTHGFFSRDATRGTAPGP